MGRFPRHRLTVGRHPMAYRRAEMNALGVTPAVDLERIPRRPPGAHRRLGDRAAAPRHGQRFRLPEHGRRDGHHERDRHARRCSTATNSKCWASRS